MNEYTFNNTQQLKNSGNNKGVPLYHHEQVPFQSITRISQPKPEQGTNPISGDLQDIIFHYQSQPDLLKLILSSKLEEDKRKAEEAKLKAKELDLLLFQQPTLDHILRRTSLDILSSPHLLQDRRDSNALGSSFTGSADSDDFDDRTFSPIPTTSSTPVSSTNHNNNTTSLIQLENYNTSIQKYNNDNSYQDYNNNISNCSMNNNLFNNNSTYDKKMKYDFPPRPRRRREMQAITKIVETRDYPYNDGHFWKNNGNTIQKKTGNKSVYYKCSNSSKGCPVNKTVTWKGHGEYLIKYRGDHLPDCNKVQRIVDI